MTEATHADLLKAIEGLRSDMEPLLEMQPELKEMVGVLNALKVGGQGVKWISGIATSLLALGGLLLAVKAMWQSWWGSV